MAILRVNLLAAACLASVLSCGFAQDEEVPAEQASKPPVAITFTPPDLEGRIVLGIFNASGKLVRSMNFEPEDPALKIDTNGYIAQWDGRDESGAACPAGRYSARGYVVGGDVKVEGDSFYFNDWVAEDHIPATSVKLKQWPDAVGVEIATAAGPVFRKIGSDGALAAADAPVAAAAKPPLPSHFESAPLASTSGRDGSWWVIVDDVGQHVVTQIGKGGTSERGLRVPKGEPQPVEVVASMTDDEILLRETAPGGVERVRMLRRAAKQSPAKADGVVVADWEVVFERTLQPCANFGWVDGKLVADSGTTEQTNMITVSLMENALDPGKKPQMRIWAAATHPGSAWMTAGPWVGASALKLVEVSSSGDWNRFILSDSQPDVELYQGDGLVVEKFTTHALDHIAAFDAGSYLLSSPSQ